MCCLYITIPLISIFTETFKVTPTQAAWTSRLFFLLCDWLPLLRTNSGPFWSQDSNPFRIICLGIRRNRKLDFKMASAYIESLYKKRQLTQKQYSFTNE